MSNVDLSPQALAQKQQEKELLDMADKLNKLADEFFREADKAGLTIKQANVFFNKHLPLLWNARVENFYGNKKVDMVL